MYLFREIAAVVQYMQTMVVGLAFILIDSNCFIRNGEMEWNLTVVDTDQRHTVCGDFIVIQYIILLI